MKQISKPVAYISYTWLTNFVGERTPDPRAEQLAEKLRKEGIDARLDMIYFNNKYGFRAPTRNLGEKKDPWLKWVGEQVEESDCVILLCTSEYTNSYKGSEYWIKFPDDFKEEKQLDKDYKVPNLWWDFHYMQKELDNNIAAPEKFIPVGFGAYNQNNIPGFIEGQTCYNLDLEEQFEGLLKAIKKQFRKKHPRSGVFISYAHHDEPEWIELLLRHLKHLERKGVEIWTDRDIATGDKFHESIQNSLLNAKIAILMVTPAFIESNYIAKHELPHLLESAEFDGLVIFWIPLKPATYPYEIKQFQAAHIPSVPVSSLRGAKRDQAFVDIAFKLANSLNV